MTNPQIRTADIKRETSISDNPLYNNICELAASQDCYFNYFKSMAQYAEILEHVSEAQGQEYLNLIDSKLLKYMDTFCTNDDVGSPIKYPYNIHPCPRLISPTTLRYVKVLSDLIKLFGPLDEARITEIGAGYGGQCKIIHDMYKPAYYYILDLESAIKLQQRYLDSFNIRVWYTPTDIHTPVLRSSLHTNLVISNYAFSECNREVQEMYLNEVILRAKIKRGYMTMNNISEYADKMHFMSQDELLRRIPGSRILPEEPLTAEGNYIIVWGV